MSATAPKPGRSLSFSALYGEQWMARKLELGMDWDAGVTTAEQRRAVIRAVILERGIADSLCMRFTNTGTQSWRSVYQRAFRVPLETDELDFAFTAEDRT